MFVTVAMGQVQQAQRDPGRLAIRGDTVQAHRDQRLRLVDAEPQMQLGGPKDFNGFSHWIGHEYQRPAVIQPLIGRPIGIIAIAPHLSRCQPHPERRADGRMAGLWIRPKPVQRVKEMLLPYRPGRWPARFCHPTARPVPVTGRRRHMFLHPDPIHRLAHQPGIAAFQPMIAPADHLLQPADGRFNRHIMRE